MVGKLFIWINSSLVEDHEGQSGRACSIEDHKEHEGPSGRALLMTMSPLLTFGQVVLSRMLASCHMISGS